MSDYSLETNHSSLNRDPAVICVWNEKHNSNVVHSFPDVWDPLEVMLNGLALIGQTSPLLLLPLLLSLGLSVSFYHSVFLTLSFSLYLSICLSLFLLWFHQPSHQLPPSARAEYACRCFSLKVIDMGEEKQTLKYSWVQFNWGERENVIFSVSFLVHLVFPSSQSLKWVGWQMLTLAPVR